VKVVTLQAIRLSQRFLLICSWTRWRLHRLCGYEVVPQSWVVGRGHSIRPPCWYMGYRLCFLWADHRTASVAG